MISENYGINKPIFRNSFTPSPQAVRPSSLNQPIYTHSHISTSPVIRFETPGSSSIIRESSIGNTSLNQSTHLNQSKRIINKDYYP
jgi:hypothetical protein